MTTQTDEQQVQGWVFDERFAAWAEREAVAFVTPSNALEVVISKHMEAAYLGGLQARDAEVQALRERNNQLMEALKDYVDADEMAVGEGYGTYPKSEHRRIRALVVGEEGSDND